ncbi:MAG: class II aldolase [Betaproteobacteria bacterium]|nr:class II aldolase/adducin family protein [Pseudomonadota bacterium]NBO04658.1 class II aldolase [Betaproteobacteria bacterium]NBO95069.1 class II aldolase [Betaproteobacteria bacterium]NBP35855.1 class II aldolase [Betaproteobacteria bacterium]NBP38194.1 class II aldolase [Betaproteobacteria bacterium]
MLSEVQARQALIGQALSLNRLGINHGKSGNVSLRWDRSNKVQGEGLLITPSGLAYENLEPQDLVWISLQDDPPRFDGDLKASSEWRMHRDLLRARPECRAVVHTHSLYASALSCMPKVQQEGIPAFHYMVATSHANRIACARYARFGSEDLSQAMLEALQAHARACLLAHHGVIAAGEDLASALALAQEVEALAMMYSQCLALGGPAILSEQAMQAVHQAFVGYRNPAPEIQAGTTGHLT